MRKGYREYRFIPGKVKFRRRMIALGVATAMTACGGYALYKHFNNKAMSSTKNLNIVVNNASGEAYATQAPVMETATVTPVPTEVPTPEPTEEPLVRYVNNGFNRGDSVKTTANVNMRLAPNIDSFKVGEVPKDAVVDRIMSTDNWDLIKYNGQISFVSTDYTVENDVDYNNEYYYVEECNDIVRTTTRLYFRTGPSTNESEICLLGKNAELVVMGRAIPYDNTDDVWYLVKYKDKIGFVKASYTTSLKEILRNTDPNITDLTIMNMAYVKNRTPLYNSNGEAGKEIAPYQLVKLLVDYGDKCLIEYGESIGYVYKSDLNVYKGTFVVTDLGEQMTYLYCNTDMVFETVCTTGKDSTPTRTGAFKISELEDHRYFSEEAQATELWGRFDGGNGYHDGEGWENIKYFGSQSYRKRKGSKGCVRLPYAAARFLRKHFKIGTKVLIKD